MNNIESFKTWAPIDAKWTQWVKPTMFSEDVIVPDQARKYEIPEFDLPETGWFNYDYESVIIVDLNGEESVTTGIALTKYGFRPIPLFNGTRGVNDIIDVDKLEKSLYWGAEQLNRTILKKDANPAFLLDGRRMFYNKHPGKYDNRWCVFPQDMPSAEYLLHNNIKKVIVVSNMIRDDLSHILCRYQEKGISIFLTENNIIKPVKVHKPSRFKSFGYRLGVILGLTRNYAGGFGGMIPDPVTYNSGTGVRGIG